MSNHLPKRTLVLLFLAVPSLAPSSELSGLALTFSKLRNMCPPGGNEVSAAGEEREQRGSSFIFKGVKSWEGARRYLLEGSSEGEGRVGEKVTGPGSANEKESTR